VIYERCSTEKEISEVCELLTQLHDMVEASGEQMDRIEAWVAQDLQQIKVRARRNPPPPPPARGAFHLVMLTLGYSHECAQGAVRELEQANRYQRSRCGEHRPPPMRASVGRIRLTCGVLHACL
jgi:hypothetical protein